MRFQTIRAQKIDIGQNLPFSDHTLKQSTLAKKTSSGNLSTLTHKLFKILTLEGENHVTNHKKESVNNALDNNENEIRSLEDLENCANAARETEAYGQYE